MNEKVTIVTQRGNSVWTACILVLSMMGGLFTPISGFTMQVVAFFVQPGFIAFMTQNLFLVTKKDHSMKG